MSNTEKVRELLASMFNYGIDCDEKLCQKYEGDCGLCKASVFLNTTGLHIEAEDQEARKFIGAPAQKLGYEEAIEDMKKDNFIKCEP